MLNTKRLWTLTSVCLLLAACGTDEERDDDPSAVVQLLEACESDADCGDLSCMCGVCSLPCEQDAACADHNGVCTAMDNDICDSAAAGMCSIECTSDADCADGVDCLEGACNVGHVEACATLPPEPDCANATPVFDDAGCQVDWTCEVQCPPIAAPQICADGSEPLPIYDDAGACVIGFEDCPDECPPSPTPEPCDDASVPRTPIYDDAGCIVDWEQCECPSIPAPDMCDDGTEPPPIYGDDGCVIGFEDCEIVCPPIAPPPACADGSEPAPIYDNAGVCVIGFEECPLECDPSPTPVLCGDTAQPPEPIYDDFGCIIDWWCPAFGPACGDGTCLPEEYCQVAHPGVPGPSSYACQPLPSECDLPETCECLLTYIEAPADCREVEYGLQIDIYYP